MKVTHQSGHVIVKLSTPLDSEKPNGIKVWHCGLALLIAGFVLGALIF